MMAIRIYDTMKKEKLELETIRKNRINIFVCGPTVYDLCHIGHARTYIAYDIIVRYLRSRGYSVFYLMNITDVDDKIMMRAKEAGDDPLALSDAMTKEFYKDLDSLDINSVNLFAKASEHIPEIIAQVRQLIEKGYAYQVDGDVFFSISNFAEYGRLSHQKPEELDKHRIDPDPRKKNPGDFALWKAHKPGELSWESPWGNGRPGWHIEDTAITGCYFGPRYDIHGGAVELIFPHHEAEIAQAESASGQHPMVNFWVHTGILRIKGEKMAKSLKNFIPIREAIAKHHPEAIRLYFASSHYRSQVDFDEENIRKAAQTIESIYETVSRIRGLANTTINKAESNKEIISTLERRRKEFHAAMEDDFNTPVAISSLIAFSHEMDKIVDEGTCLADLKQVLTTFSEFGNVIGILGAKGEEKSKEAIVPDMMNLVLEIREELRKKGDWTSADSIRDKLNKIGIVVEDQATGPHWKKSMSKL
jgi:cysteinyl-tRNA synthetase